MAKVDIQHLAPTHDRAAFCCGVPVLDRDLAELADQDVERRVSNCFVAVTGDGVVAAHCTFAATSPPLTDLDPDRAKRLPRYPSLPAALARRLAVDERFKG